MRNIIPTRSYARQPRGLVKVNGQPCDGWVKVDTEETDFADPDTFTATFAMSALPRDRDAAWWASQDKVDLDLHIGEPLDAEAFGADDLPLVFSGRTDDVDVDWDGGSITITGRDRTADLIDNKTSEKYVNLTASDIATKLATKYGLTPVVTATTTKAGKYYQIDQVDLKQERTEWDLITWLAREERFIVFVRGKELHFKPQPTAKQDPYVLEHHLPTPEQLRSGNYTRLNTSRTLTVAKGIEVTVKSWNGKQKKAFTKTAKRAGKNPKSEIQKYAYTIAGLTSEQAQDRANQILAEVSKHEMKLRMSGPADASLRIDDAILLKGTGTDFDQTYFPDSISRSLSVVEGYTWEVTAKNHSPESEPTL